VPISKHGAHRIELLLPPVAASGTVQSTAPYDYLYGNYGVYDSTTEVINRATLVASTAWTAGDTITLNHYNLAGALVDAVSVSTTAAAHVPVDVTNSTASTGNSFVKGWTMVPGDSVELVVVATTTAGARGGVGVVLLIDSKGA
jgi:hypothetical protein